MNILQVIPYFVSAWSYGGPVQVAYRLSREMVRRNHKVTVYTTDALDSAGRIGKKEEVIDGIKVKRFRNASNYLAYRHKIFLSPGMLRSAGKELGNFDIIHMHEYRTFQNVMVHHYAGKYGIPYILQAHGALPRIMAKQVMKQAYDNIWGLRLLRDAARVVALTKTEAAQYQNAGVAESKIEIVPNGIDLSEFQDMPQEGEFKQKYGLADNERVVLYLGRIHRIKGLGLLARAFAGVSTVLSDVRLVIVGPDEGYLPVLKKLARELGIEDKVLYTGPLYGNEKLQAYVDASVYVLPSVYETFPVTVLEACACGLPVVVTENCGIADVVAGQAGLVVPQDEEQLREAVVLLLSDTSMRQKFGEQGKSLVRAKFGWNKIGEQVEKLYSSCLS